MVGNSWKFTHDPDELASSFQSQSNTTIRFIHENYLNTMGLNMDGAAYGVDAISLADVFNSEWRVRNNIINEKNEIEKQLMICTYFRTTNYLN